ncbi:Hypothetical predicted protein [Paramuricea clavata]|uniref:Uncharacterized protein n=1 Tax=Paramuricea clavata TaxID=317549 RepID=A0A7D9DB60_PARCT|nr:Hypothetical predicted protein [Paramuricea clavata]
MFLLLGQIIKEKILERVTQANCISMLCDEVSDVSNKEQPVNFVQFVDRDFGKAEIDFLAVDDVAYKEENDCTAIGLLKAVANIKFLSTVYLLHEVLPALSHLSKAFQKGNISFSAIHSAVLYTTDQLVEIAAKQKSLESLKRDLEEDGKLASTELTLTTSSEDYLRNLTTKYVDSLTKNIENRFSESLLIFTAFEILDPMGVPAISDEAFKEYAISQIKIFADHFFQEKKKKKELTEEIECEWRKIKYNLLELKYQVSQHILDPSPKNKNLSAQTPTE